MFRSVLVCGNLFLRCSLGVFVLMRYVLCTFFVIRWLISGICKTYILFYHFSSWMNEYLWICKQYLIHTLYHIKVSKFWSSVASVCFMFTTPAHYTHYTHIFQPNVSTTVELVRHRTCGVPTFLSCLWHYVAGNQTGPSLRMLLHNLFIIKGLNNTVSSQGSCALHCSKCMF